MQTNLKKANKLSENPCQINDAIAGIPRTISNENVPQSIVKAPITKAYVPCFTKRKSVKEVPKTLSKAGRSAKEKPLVPCFKKNDCENKARILKVKTSTKGDVDRDWRRVNCSCPNDKGMAASRGSLNKRQAVTTDKTVNTSSDRAVDNSHDNTFCAASQLQRWPVDTLKGASESELMKKKKRAEVVVDIRKMAAENKVSDHFSRIGLNSSQVF